jgi:hypothetical protein
LKIDEAHNGLRQPAREEEKKIPGKENDLFHSATGAWWTTAHKQRLKHHAKETLESR